MNAVISLCHFCENHGPRVLFSTQSFHTKDLFPTECDKAKYRLDFALTHLENSDKGNPNKVLSAPSSPVEKRKISVPNNLDSCEGCQSLHFQHPGFVSNDTEANVAYVSSQNPHHQQIFSMLRQSCIRSLSCEVCQGREGPIFYGDSKNGHTFSYTFYVMDSEARGFQRLYSVIVVMMDKIYLLNSWPFLVKHIKYFIELIQHKAKQVYDAETRNKTVKSVRVARQGMTAIEFRKKRGMSKNVRSLSDLTNDKNIFRKVHQTFSWILKMGGCRLSETILEGSPIENSILNLEKQEETEEGFVKLFSEKYNANQERIQEASAPASDDDELETKIDIFQNLRHFVKSVGLPNFHTIAHHTLIGHQIVVRTRYKRVAKSIIDCLKSLLPQGCCKIIYYSRKYEHAKNCNFLGISKDVVIPDSVAENNYLFIDFNENVNNVETGEYFTIKSSKALLNRQPKILSQIEKILLNSILNDFAVEQSIIILKEEWLSKVKVLFKYKVCGGRSSEDVTKKLLEVVKATTNDMELLMFWKIGLSMQYKKQMTMNLQNNLFQFFNK